MLELELGLVAILLAIRIWQAHRQRFDPQNRVRTEVEAYQQGEQQRRLISVFKKDSSGKERAYCARPADHPDIQKFLDAPGFYLRLPDGTVDPGKQ